MYSLLMMAAMATSPDTTNFGWRFAGCTGCTGYASCYGSCYGGVYFGGSCYGGSCYGSSCYGSSCYGSSCYGSSCHGSCTGYSCSGCYGGGVLFPRLRGLLSGSGCCGGSCYGSCTGSSCTGCTGAVYYGVGCYGSGCYGSSCHGCTGSVSYGCAGCGGVIVGSAAMPAAPVYGSLPLEGTSSILSAKAAEPVKGIATLALELPAKATLFVDGQAITGEGTTRQFHTPELTVGQTYYYDFKAEMLVDGKPQVEEKRIVVRAGDKLSESFPKLIAMTSKPSTVLASK